MRKGSQPVTSRPSKTHPAASRGQEAHDGLQRRGLAGAVAAHQRHDLAAAQGEVHAEQHLRLAIGRPQAFRHEDGIAARQPLVGHGAIASRFARSAALTPVSPR